MNSNRRNILPKINAKGRFISGGDMNENEIEQRGMHISSSLLNSSLKCTPIDIYRQMNKKAPIEPIKNRQEQYILELGQQNELSLHNLTKDNVSNTTQLNDSFDSDREFISGEIITRPESYFENSEEFQIPSSSIFIEIGNHTKLKSLIRTNIN